MSSRDDGGPAFARPVSAHEWRNGDIEYADDQSGMALRDYYIAHNPIDYRAACITFGSRDDEPNLSNDTTRAAFFAVWAMARQEMADAMLKARNPAAENEAADTVDQLFVREQNAIGERDRLQLRLDRIREYCVVSAFDDKLEHIIKLAEGQLP